MLEAGAPNKPVRPDDFGALVHHRGIDRNLWPITQLVGAGPSSHGGKGFERRVPERPPEAGEQDTRTPCFAGAKGSVRGRTEDGIVFTVDR